MLKELNANIDRWFGEQPHEKLLRGSANPKVKSLLRTVSFLRFILFPVYICLWFTGFAINLTIFLLEIINKILERIYSTLIDSEWLRLSWFELTHEEMVQECKSLDK